MRYHRFHHFIQSFAPMSPSSHGFLSRHANAFALTTGIQEKKVNVQVPIDQLAVYGRPANPQLPPILSRLLTSRDGVDPRSLDSRRFVHSHNLGRRAKVM